jgi:alpha-L-fucosidase
VELLIESVSKGGNLILNVGPTARGVFDYRAQERLQGIGEWIKFNGKSVYGCTQAPKEFTAPDNTLLTYNATTKKLYIHLLDYPLETIVLKGYAGKIKYAQFLHDNSEIKFYMQERDEFSTSNNSTNDLVLTLPVQKPNTVIPVIELDIK